MNNKFGGLGKKAEPEKQVEALKPTVTAKRPQGAVRKGKNPIRSRTFSLEDEFIEFLDYLVVLSGEEKFTRTDVARAAFANLSGYGADRIVDILRKNSKVKSAEIEGRTLELKRQVAAMERAKILESVTPEELEKLIDLKG